MSGSWCAHPTSFRAKILLQHAPSAARKPRESYRLAAPQGQPSTRALLFEPAGFAALLPHLFSEDVVTLTYALGAVQNTCPEVAYLELLQEAEVVVRLQDLAGEAHPPSDRARAPDLGPFEP